MELENADMNNQVPVQNEGNPLAPDVDTQDPQAPEPVVDDAPAFDPSIMAPEDAESYKQEIRTNLKEAFMQEASRGVLKEASKHPGVFLGTTLIEMTQDVANSVIDTVNYVDRKMGDGEELLDNLNYATEYLPQDNVSKTTRSLAKFIIGSQAIYKGSQAVIQGGKWTSRAIKTVDPFVTEFLFETTEPQREQIVEFGKKFPLLHDVMEYIDPYTEESEKNFERRIRNSMFGVAEAGVLEVALKVFKLVRKNRKLFNEYLKDETGTVGKGPKDTGTIKANPESVPSKIDEEIPPPIPKGAGEPPPLPEEMPPLPKDLSGKEVTGYTPPETGQLSPEGVQALEGNRSAAVDEVRDINVLDELGQEEYAKLKKQGKIKYDLTPEEIDEIIISHDRGYGDINTNAAKDMFDNDILNLTFMNTEEDLRKLVKRLVEVAPERYAKKKWTQAELNKLARTRGTSPKKLLRWTEESGLKIGDIIASEMLLERAAGQVQANFKKYADGEYPKEFIVQQFQVLRSMAYKIRDQRSMAGLLLRETGFDVKSSPSARKLMDMYDVFGGDLDRIAREVNKVDVTPSMMTKAINWAREVPLPSALMQIRYTAFLSNPKTHIKNITSAVTTTGSRPIMTGGAAVINVPYTVYRKTLRKLNLSTNQHQYLDGSTFSDAMAEFRGGIQGIGDAFKIASSKIRGQDVEFEGVRDGFSKIPMFLKNTKPANSQEALAKSMVTLLGNPKAAGIPLEFSDQFMKHINANMTKRRMVQKELARMKRNGATDGALEIRYKELSENPTEEIKNAMYREAEEATFTERNINGTEGFFDWKGHLKDLADQPLIKLLAPFGNVNINMINYTMQRTILAPFTRDFRRAVSKGTAEEAQQALSKMAVTTSALMLAVYHLKESGAIVGSGSRNYNKKRIDMFTSKGQNYITVGGKDIPIDRDNPYFNVLFTMVDLMEIKDKVGDDAWTEHYGEYAMATSQLMNPSFLIDSTSGLVEALESEDPAKMERFLAKFAQGFTTPYAGAANFVMKDMQMSTRPETTSKGDVLKTFRDQVIATYAPQLKAKARNLLGQEMEYPTGMLNMITDGLGVTEKTEASPAMEELRRLSNTTTIADSVKGISRTETTGERIITDSILSDAFTMPKRTIDVSSLVGKSKVIELRAEQYEKLMLSVAGYNYTSDADGVAIIGKRKAVNLEGTIEKVMNTSWYKKENTSDRSRFNAVKSIVNAFKVMGETNFALNEYGKELLSDKYMKQRVQDALIDAGVK